jgi:AraC-like DNA-binding protein
VQKIEQSTAIMQTYILQYTTNTMNDQFIELCKDGKLEEAKKLFAQGNIDVHYQDQHALRWSCAKGHLEVIEWLFTLDWRWSININVSEYAFRFSCQYQQIKTVKWLLTLRKFNDYVIDAYLPESLYEYAFQNGYQPTQIMERAYKKYKAKILREIQEKNTDGELTIFEIKGIPELITMYV